jgi:hypothetical protein
LWPSSHLLLVGSEGSRIGFKIGPVLRLASCATAVLVALELVCDIVVPARLVVAASWLVVASQSTSSLDAP